MISIVFSEFKHPIKHHEPISPKVRFFCTPRTLLEYCHEIREASNYTVHKVESTKISGDFPGVIGVKEIAL